MAQLLGLPNSNYLNVGDSATYGYTFEHMFDKKDIRTKGGKLFTYITPSASFRRFKIPMTFVASSDVSIINSYFATATNLRYIEDDTFPNSFYEVRIVGMQEPFDKFIKPYFRQHYAGEIIIETVWIIDFG